QLPEVSLERHLGGSQQLLAADLRGVDPPRQLGAVARAFCQCPEYLLLAVQAVTLVLLELRERIFDRVPVTREEDRRADLEEAVERVEVSRHVPVGVGD